MSMPIFLSLPTQLNLARHIVEMLWRCYRYFLRGPVADPEMEAKASRLGLRTVTVANPSVRKTPAPSSSTAW